MEKKRALIRTVAVLYAAFHPQISKCFNTTTSSLFTMWETRRKCALRQRSEHEVTPPRTALAHTHPALSFSFFLQHFWPCHARPALSPGERQEGEFGVQQHGRCKGCCSLPGGMMARRGLSLGHRRRNETGELRVGFESSGEINFPPPRCPQ